MIKKYIKNYKLLFTSVLYIRDFLPKFYSSPSSNEEYQEILRKLKEDGIVVIPNFYTHDECNEMVDEYEKLQSEYGKNFRNDRRVFGIERLSETFRKYHFSANLPRDIGAEYLGDELVLQTTMAAKITPDPSTALGSGGGWHRDSFSRQFKAIAYLDDVGMDNGPFMYIKGSHKLKNIKRVVFGLKDHTPGDYRYSQQEIEQIITLLDSPISYFTAPKGTLILADVRGLHTGMEIKRGHRYAIFNYYIAKSFHQKDSSVESLASSNYLR